MFLREKRIGAYSYVYLVESVREDGRVKQRVIKNVGRKDVVAASGDLDRLARSAARLARRTMVLSLLEGGTAPGLTPVRIGPALLFERLWAQTGCREVVLAAAKGRGFEFAVERAVFLTVLHRLMVSGSDRAAARWREDYRIAGSEALELHHLYRTMGWLGEAIAAADEADGADRPAPRRTKDVIEEALFARRRDLFSELSLVFMDTTSLYFEGRGGETLGQYGYSRDHRPDLKQMVVAAVIDGRGRPLCCELWPGNSADVVALIPVIDRLRERFGIGRVCVVADRGMISAETIAALEERKLDYILGVRERGDKLVREVVLADKRPFNPLTLSKRGKAVDYGAKEVKLGGVRYIVCLNHDQKAKDAADRQAILDSLKRQLKKGDKALVGNAGYRRYLKSEGGGFAIDRAKVADDAKFDGIFVLRTNTALHPLQALLRYKELWMVEQVAESGATRTVFPAQGGQQSGDCGQRVKAG